MTPTPRPQWLELANNDKATSPGKVSKGLPVLALVATAAIIGVGTIFAQPQELSLANADSNVAATQTAQQVSLSDTVEDATNPVAQVAYNSTGTRVQNASIETTSTTHPVGPTTTGTTPSIKNPSIGTMPTGGGDDDEDDDDDDDDDFEGEDD